MVHSQETWKKSVFAVRGLSSVALALGLTLFLSPATPAQEQNQGQPPNQQQPSQQDQQQDQQGTGAQQSQGQSPDAQQQPAPPAAAQPPKPTYSPQDADKPPYSKDRPARPSTRSQAPPPSEYSPEEDEAGSYRGAQQPAAPPNPDSAAAPRGPVPPTLTIPAGTVLLVRINEFLSSDRNQVGDRITAVLQQPIVVNGWVVARRGQTLMGQVEAAVKAGRIKGVSQLGIELTDLTVVDGEQRPILTELWKGSGGTSHGQDAATIGTTTALGAAIGAAADWGRGAAIGAGAGAAAGIGAVLLTRGHPTIIEPETQLSFRLVDPVKVDTTQSQQAFLPVSQQDFDGGGREERRPRHVAGGYPPPGPYGCGYYEPCYLYPGYAGFYDGFWWGPSFYGGGFGRRGFRH
jgi:hypothetical protein